jgi:hypothetical protein
MSKVPVIAAGEKDYITLVFPTVPADESGNYMTCWDKYAGHGSSSTGWLSKQPIHTDLDARELLAQYVRYYHEGNENEYELVDSVNQDYHEQRRAEAAKWRTMIASN